MKVKSGFATFTKNKAPLKHPTVIHVTKEGSSTLGKLLPNGFRVGERVFYIYSFSNPCNVYGTVVDYLLDEQLTKVWAKWENSTTGVFYMPIARVHHA